MSRGSIEYVLTTKLRILDSKKLDGRGSNFALLATILKLIRQEFCTQRERRRGSKPPREKSARYLSEGYESEKENMHMCDAILSL